MSIGNLTKTCGYSHEDITRELEIERIEYVVTQLPAKSDGCNRVSKIEVPAKHEERILDLFDKPDYLQSQKRFLRPKKLEYSYCVKYDTGEIERVDILFC